MKLTTVSFHVPQDPNIYIGVVIFALAMLFLNVGLIWAMRLERRVR